MFMLLLTAVPAIAVQFNDMKKISLLYIISFAIQFLFSLLSIIIGVFSMKLLIQFSFLILSIAVFLYYQNKIKIGDIKPVYILALICILIFSIFDYFDYSISPAWLDYIEDSSNNIFISVVCFISYAINATAIIQKEPFKFRIFMGVYVILQIIIYILFIVYSTTYFDSLASFDYFLSGGLGIISIIIAFCRIDYPLYLQKRRMKNE